MGSVYTPLLGIPPLPNPEPNSAAEEASNIMNTMLGYAQDAFNRAVGLDYGVPTIDLSNINFPPIVGDALDFSTAKDALDELLASLPDLPNFDEIPTDTPEMGDLYTDPPELYPVDIPDFSGTAPPLVLPDAPDWVDYVSPTKPSTETIATPDRPDIVIPDEPNLADINIPDPYAIEIPTFDETLVETNLVAPSNTFAYNEQAYESTLMDAVKSGLLGMIQNGDYGLDATDEDRLFNREREREIQAMNMEVEEVRRDYSLTGLPFPTGAMLKAVQRVRQKVNDKVSSVNRDVAIKKADLYWEGKKFTYSQAIELEKVLTTLHNAVWERTLNAAKAQIQVSIDIFNASVELARIRQERHKILAEVFATRVQGEVAKIEAYKALLDSAKIRVEINDSLIKLYTARLDGVKTVADVYKTDVEVSKILAELEKLKIDIFRAEVEAFIGQVQAKASEFEAYKAAVQGEATKMEAFKTEAEAYAAHVDGLKSKIESNKLLLEAFIQRNQSVIDIYSAEAQAQSDVRTALLQKVQAQADSYRAHVTAFDAEAGAIVKVFDLEGRQLDMQHRAQLLTLQLNIETVKAELEKVIRTAELEVSTMQAKGSVYAALASAALSAMNVNASLSDSYSASESLSGSLVAQAIESHSVSSQLSNSTVNYHYYEH